MVLGLKWDKKLLPYPEAFLFLRSQGYFLIFYYSIYFPKKINQTQRSFHPSKFQQTNICHDDLIIIQIQIETCYQWNFILHSYSYLLNYSLGRYIDFNLYQQMELNSHGTITEHNLNQKYQDTKKHGPLRLKISRPIVDAMNQLGWIWSLDGGDLLAAFRDGGKMLPHDDDFDLWVFTNDVTLESSHQEKVQLLQKMLEAIRQKLPKPLEVRIVSSYCYKLQVYDPQYGYYLFRDHPYHNVTCDLSLVAPMKKVQPEGEELYRLLHEQCAKYNLNIQKKHLVPVKVNGIMFEGYQYNCPADTESYLKTHYGYLGKESCYDKESGLYKKKPEKVA